MPWSVVKLPFFSLGFAYNLYGHAAVRYTLPSGEQKVMNIVNDDEGMVYWSTPEEFLFTTKWHKGCQPKGLYNRDMIGLRVEEIPPEKMLEMHEYFCALAERSQEKKVKYDLGFLDLLTQFLPLFGDFLHKWLPVDAIERGNCARWTSKGLLKAGVVTKSTMWPKSVWINMFENYETTQVKRQSNLHVVSYRRIKHAKLSYGVDAIPVTLVAPLQTIRSFLYYDLDSFADVIVEVPDGTIRAVVKKRSNPRRQSRLRNWVANSTLLITLSMFLTAQFLGRGLGFNMMQRNLTLRHP